MMDMLRTTALTSAMLVGIIFLLILSCSPSAAAEPNFNQSLEKIKDFHNRFKDPSFLNKGGGLQSDLPPLTGFANEASVLGCPTWQMNGLVAIDGNKHSGIAYDGLIGPTSLSANLLDIEVSRITVIAINMVEGGNAVATSDIVLNPVQYLGFSSDAEVEEKLK
jgi:hypothetical protein